MLKEDKDELVELLEVLKKVKEKTYRNSWSETNENFSSLIVNVYSTLLQDMKFFECKWMFRIIDTSYQI